MRHLMRQRSRFRVSCVHPIVIYSNLNELVTAEPLFGPLCVMARQLQSTEFAYEVFLYCEPCEEFREGRFSLDVSVACSCIYKRPVQFFLASDPLPVPDPEEDV